jgi:hypothetical protein
MAENIIPCLSQVSGSWLPQEIRFLLSGAVSLFPIPQLACAALPAPGES